MGFPEKDRKRMLTLVGVGPMMLTRLEQLGFTSLKQLAKQDPNSIGQVFTRKMGLAGWHRTPKARRTILTLIEFARAEVSQRSAGGG
ncbi:MAG: helix-hairpin-helix domain-containing protein [Chloroflexota bacterium]